MASRIRPIVIDPNGDTLLELSEIKWELPAWEGESTETTVEEEARWVKLEAELVTTEDKDVDEVHFLVSSRQLRIVSRYFGRLFASNFSEATVDSLDGRYHIKTTEFHPTAITHVMNAAHTQTKSVPRTVNIAALVHIAVLIDYYEMHEAMTFYTDIWLPSIRSSCAPMPPSHCKTVVVWIFLARFFKLADTFEEMTATIIRESKGPVQDLGLPIPDVVEKLEEMRRSSLDKIITELRKLFVRLKTGDAGCCFEYSAMLLGAFILRTREAGIFKQIEDHSNPIKYIMSFQKASRCVEDLSSTGTKGRQVYICPFCGSRYSPSKGNNYVRFAQLVESLRSDIAQDMKLGLDLKLKCKPSDVFDNIADSSDDGY